MKPVRAPSVAALVAAMLAIALRGADARLVLSGAGVLDGSKVYPVSKVITLLREMQKQLEKEADDDESIYEKMQCWCTTNDKEKTQSISDAQARVADLTTVIETSAARSARLGAEIKSHEEDLEKSRHSLDDETAIREKQAAEFNGEEKTMLESVKALGAAIIVLSKHHALASAAFLEDGEVAKAIHLARSLIQRHEVLLLDSITPSQRRLLIGLSQIHQEPGYGQQATFKQSYTPQSGEVLGILKQMKETFENNLSEAQKEELANARAYEELKAAKQAEIQATEQALEQKKVQLAETDEKNAQAKQDIEDTTASLSSDEQFLLGLKQSCSMTEQEWQSRQKMRSDEIQAVAQAISILSSDVAHDTFSATFNPSFLQERTRPGVEADRRAAAAKRRHILTRVAEKLSRVGQRNQNPKFAALSVAVRLDPLAKVKEAIDKLVAELLAEKEVEIKERDNCVDLMHQNELESEQFSRDMESLESQEATLKAEISELTEAMKTLSAEVTELQVQIKRAGEDRELENKDFQSTVSDQQETQKLLQKALEVLKAVYKDQVATGGAALAQQAPGGEEAQPTAPPGFSAYGQNRAAGGVVGMIQQIISDAAHLEQMAIKDEQTAQQQYEAFVKDTNTAILTKQTGLVNKGEGKAKAEGTLLEVADSISGAKTELLTLDSTRAALKQNCDFLLRNFAVRQEARDEEVDALREAKAVLSGMKLDL